MFSCKGHLEVNLQKPSESRLLTRGAHARTVHFCPGSGKDPAAASVASLSVCEVVEGGQTQVDMPPVPADVIDAVSDVSDDETTSLAVVGQHAAGAAPTEVFEVAGGRVVGVCGKGRK